MKIPLFLFCCMQLLLFSCNSFAWGKCGISDTLDTKPVHRIGLDLRPAYMFPTHGFFCGNNAKGKSVNTQLAAHLRYSFQFSPASRLRQLYPYAYQGVGVAYNTFPQTSEMGLSLIHI